MDGTVSNWQQAMDGLDEEQACRIIAWLLGRSGVTDEEFIAKCDAV